MDNKINIATKKLRTIENEPTRFFQNVLLNNLSHTSATAIYIIYIPIIFYFFWQSILYHNPLTVFTGLTVGLFIWSYVEYLVHRFAFHFKFNHERLKMIHSICHLRHHVYPQDNTKYQTLLLISLPSGIAFYYLFQLLFGEYSNPIYTGFVLGYVLYEFVHYSTHKLKMNFRWIKSVKQNHMYHHYFEDHTNFGVTSPFWDVVFRTRAKKTSDTK